MKRRTTLLSAAVAVGGAATGWIAWRKLSADRKIQARRAEYERLLASIQRLQASGLVARLGMAEFLRFWSDEVLVRLRRARFPLDNLQSDLVNRASLLLPPATQLQIETLAQRARIELPGSLRDFYRTSNGMYTAVNYGGEQLELLPTDRVRWMHELDPKLVETWTQVGTPAPTNEKYFVYGKQQDPVNIRTEYMKRMLCLGPIVDGGVLCLNPAIRFPSGELEAWNFSVKHPGAYRFQTLAAMLEARCEEDCWFLDEISATYGWRRET